jgi:hypothetical protein
MLHKGQKVRITKPNRYFKEGQIVEVHNPDKYGAWLIGDDLNDKYTHWYFEYGDFELVDTVVESIIEKFRQRSAVGIKKYNTTLDRTDLSEEQWCNHLLEEMMDAILYCYRLREQLKNNKK